MMIPGSNILNLATSVIAKQTVAYHRYTGRTQNEVGVDVAQYAAAQSIRGSWQPVPRRLYQNLGLDFNNNYINFYTPRFILDVQRDVSGDQLTFYGGRYQVLSSTDWANIDGWVAVLCVQVGDKDAR